MIGGVRDGVGNDVNGTRKSGVKRRGGGRSEA